MAALTFPARLGRKGADLERIAAEVIEKPQRLPELLEGLSAAGPRVKYGTAKVLRRIANAAPQILLPVFDDLARLLQSDNKIIQWEGLYLIGRLAGSLNKRRMVAVVGPVLAPIRGPVLITAANAIDTASRIAHAEPRLADLVAGAILEVEKKGKYATTECRHVAAGAALDALIPIVNLVVPEVRQKIRAFAERQLKSPRASTRRRAERLVRRMAEKTTATPAAPGREARGRPPIEI